MKPKRLKSLKLNKINQRQQKVVKGGDMAERCICRCYVGLSHDIANYNAAYSN